ncbi:cysteine cluster protein [Oleiphilus messinensis]|uniref:UPF0260 protein OLMES_3347 n=1 Tax=Oleiphilus messinensis TaxID=141451 RepID=A0A1Y0IA38_9GAMM|nr:YcgN family cysteine cluster protein [Oleiphilus messinensis]ARU57387.1 cysteine cluster protein [Oleiphilus messinensis]
MTGIKPFWKEKTLHQMTKSEWESLCDGCAKCCLQKLEDEDTGDVFYTDIVCQYLDESCCGCTVYQERHEKVPTCIWLKPDDLQSLGWLPSTCAYRLVYEGKDLPEWHPLLSGDPNSVHKAHASIKGKVISENDVPEDEWEDHIIDHL